jgi:hypothetical protein
MEDEYGHHSLSGSYNIIAWRSTNMAIQQELGLLAQRRYRNDSSDRANSFTAWQNMKTLGLRH